MAELTCKDHNDKDCGYLQWHEWAAKMGRTHRQVRCPVCGLFKIWMTKDAAKKYKKEQLAKAIATSNALKASMRAKMLGDT